ncbi:MAG: PAS domain-containing protein [Arenicella sp.]|jgi:PAS domain-containing protein
MTKQENSKQTLELVRANKELARKIKEIDKRPSELIIANRQKEKRADELILTNIEKHKQALALALANKELASEHMLVGYRSKMERVAKDLSLLIDRANAPIFRTDAQGRINSWNQQAELSTIQAKHEVMGQDLVDNFIVEEHRLR